MSHTADVHLKYRRNTCMPTHTCTHTNTETGFDLLFFFFLLVRQEPGSPLVYETSGAQHPRILPSPGSTKSKAGPLTAVNVCLFVSIVCAGVRE